jgi:hypothetical protein
MYIAARFRFKKMVRTNRRRQKARAILKAINDFKHGGGRRGYYNIWAHSITKGHPTQSNHAKQPLRDPTAEILLTNRMRLTRARRGIIGSFCAILTLQIVRLPFTDGHGIAAEGADPFPPR